MTYHYLSLITKLNLTFDCISFLESGEGRYKEKQYVEEHKSLYVVLCCCVVLCCVVLLCGVVPSLAWSYGVSMFM